LRVLVAGCQATLGKVRRGKALTSETQLSVLGDVSDRYYAAVLRGITTPEIAPVDGLEKAEATRRSIERNRRSTFARGAKSALNKWVSTGGDMRALDVETVTRDPLLAEVRQRKGEGNGKVERHARALVREVQREAKNDPLGARAHLEAVLRSLEDALDAMVDGNTGAQVHTATQIMATRPAHARMPRPGSRVQA
jgi:hypothetical protein